MSACKKVLVIARSALCGRFLAMTDGLACLRPGFFLVTILTEFFLPFMFVHFALFALAPTRHSNLLLNK